MNDNISLASQILHNPILARRLADDIIPDIPWGCTVVMALAEEDVLRSLIHEVTKDSGTKNMDAHQGLTIRKKLSTVLTYFCHRYKRPHDSIEVQFYPTPMELRSGIINVQVWYLPGSFNYALDRLPHERYITERWMFERLYRRVLVLLGQRSIMLEESIDVVHEDLEHALFDEA